MIRFFFAVVTLLLGITIVPVAIANDSPYRGVWQAADGEIIELGNTSFTVWPAPTKVEKWQAGEYTYSRGQLTIKMGGQQATATADVDGERLTLSFPGKTLTYYYRGSFGQNLGHRLARQADPGAITIVGNWVSDSGVHVEMRNSTFDIKRNGRLIHRGQYRVSPNHDHIQMWPADVPLERSRIEAAFRVSFDDANTMIWHLPDGPVEFTWAGGYTPRPYGLYDPDTYRVSPDASPGVAPGGSNSWCLSNC